MLLKRITHVVFGHNYDSSTLVDKMTSENHRDSDKDYIYTVNLRLCKCGIHFFDSGMEFRK